MAPPGLLVPARHHGAAREALATVPREVWESLVVQAFGEEGQGGKTEILVVLR